MIKNKKNNNFQMMIELIYLELKKVDKVSIKLNLNQQKDMLEILKKISLVKFI